MVTRSDNRRRPRFVEGLKPRQLNNVVGLDLGTKKVGVATSQGTQQVRAPNIDTLDREAWLIPAVIAAIPHNTPLVVIEAPVIHGGGNARSRVRILGFYRLIEVELHRRRLRYGFVVSGTLKVWATGHGHASKQDMINAATEHAGHIVGTDDEADAYWLRNMGIELVSQGLDPSSKAKRDVALKRLYESIKETS